MDVAAVWVDMWDLSSFSELVGTYLGLDVECRWIVPSYLYLPVAAVVGLP